MRTKKPTHEEEEELMSSKEVIDVFHGEGHAALFD